MAVNKKNFSFDEAVSNLLISNGVTLDGAIKGKGIFDTMSSGMAWTVSKTECTFEETEMEKTCETLAKAKRWSSAVLREVKSVASLKEDGAYVCSGGCTEGRNNGLLVFLTVAYKENSTIKLLVVTSDQNVSIAPEEFQRIVTTVQPIMASGKWSIRLGDFHYERSYQKKIGETVSKNVEIEKMDRQLTEHGLASLRDFCLAKVCQKFLGRQRCEAFDGPDEIRRILCCDFDKYETLMNNQKTDSVERQDRNSQRYYRDEKMDETQKNYF